MNFSVLYFYPLQLINNLLTNPFYLSHYIVNLSIFYPLAYTPYNQTRRVIATPVSPLNIQTNEIDHYSLSTPFFFLLLLCNILSYSIPPIEL